MKILLLSLLVLGLLVSGCTKLPEGSLTSSVPSATLTSNVSLTPSPTPPPPENAPTATPQPSPIDLHIKGNTEGGSIAVLEDGVQVPPGILSRAYFSMPGYVEKLPLDLSEHAPDLMELFSLLADSKAAPEEDWEDWGYFPNTGSAVWVEYTDGLLQRYSVMFSPRYDGESVSISSEPYHHDNGGLIFSAEMVEMVHEITGWEPFDPSRIYEADEMLVKGVSGVVYTEETFSINGDELERLLQLMAESAEVEGDSATGYGISFVLRKNGADLYHGRFASTGDHSMAIETEFFSVDKGAMEIIYNVLGSDTSVLD